MKDKLRITETEYREMIKKAEEAGACINSIGIFKSLSLEEALGHKKLPYWLYQYARDVIKGRWPEAESVIIKDSFCAYIYAKEVIKGRWPEAEEMIIKDAYGAYIYAKEVIKGRWPEAEPIIIKESGWAYYYAIEVINGSWPEAEETIKKNKYCWSEYKRHFGIKE